MNVIELLKEQHREVKELFEKLIAGERRQRRVVLPELAKALRLHVRLEEKFIYPAASRVFQGDAGRERILLSYEEHGAAERALAALEATPPADKRFVARTKVLKMLVEEHIDDEETKVLPEIESRLQESGIERLSAQVERRLAQLRQEVAPQPATRSKSTRLAARTARSAPNTKKTARGGNRGQPARRVASSARKTGRGQSRMSGRARSSSRGNQARAPRRGEPGSES